MMGTIRLPDGTVVRGAALAERIEDAPWRTFGLYLDPRWRPSWPHRLITWPDLGLPADDADATAAIQDALDRAQAGEGVEVGCDGGLGRTGTVLACMAVLTGVPVPEAVPWVRAHYAPAAVETAAQARWVLTFAERVGAEG
jgi:protein-tyrosine phosphatase